jgi:SMC interacting uncharacterized protein involved in chromosome segregation
MIQLDFLDENQLMTLLRQMKEVKESADKTRKSLFARHRELEERFEELEKKVKAQ